MFPAFPRPNQQRLNAAALRRLGYAKDEISVSGFRATASTLPNKMDRWNPDAIERQLAIWKRTMCVEHACRRVLQRTCRVEMMQVRADHLDQLRYGSPVDGRL